MLLLKKQQKSDIEVRPRRRGVHAKIIQERLGHSKIGTIMDTYGHVLQKAEQSAATHFESLFKK